MLLSDDLFDDGRDDLTDYANEYVRVDVSDFASDDMREDLSDY